MGKAPDPYEQNDAFVNFLKLKCEARLASSSLASVFREVVAGVVDFSVHRRFCKTKLVFGSL